MRLALAIWLSLVLSGFAQGQAPNNLESIVGQIIDRGIIDGHDRKVMVALGDAGAIFATKTLGGRNLTSSTINNTLIVIRESFADLYMVGTVADRQPRTTLLLLRYLDLSTSDTELRKLIADTRTYVQDQYAKLLHGTK